MESLFGVPTSQLARVLAVATGVLLAGLLALALRRRTLFRMGIRNAARRPLRSVVIVVGLMLSTVVVATAFSTGDAMTLTVRSLITGSVGTVDEAITSSQSDFTQLSSRNIESLASGGGLPAASTGYFPLSQYTSLRDGVRQSRAIAGLMPAIVDQAPVADGDAQLAHPNVGLLGLPAEEVAGFDTPRDEQRQPRPIAALAEGEVYVNRAAADLLSTGADHKLKLFTPELGAANADTPVEHDFTVRAVLQNGQLAGPQATVFLPLGTLQQLRGESGQINEIMVVNRCGSDIAACSRQAALDLRKVLVDRGVAETVREALVSNSGRSVLNGLQARRSGRGKDQIRDLQRTAGRGQVTDHLIYLLGDPQVAGSLRATASFLPSRDGRVGRTLRSLNRLTVVEVKLGALNQANDYGNVLTSSFLVLGLFSIAASLLLVFLVFVMLAAERRGEMGIARAIGLQRSHLVQSFSFEGMVYDLASALLGVVAGVGISALIVDLVARALTGYGIPVERHVEPRSLVIAFCLGLIVTFVTVVFSAWRVSRLNIVEAIRGITAEPELDEGVFATLRGRFRSAGDGVGSLTSGSLSEAMRQFYHALSGLAVIVGMLVMRGLLPIAAGFVLLLQGRQQQHYLPFAFGLTLLVVGGGLLLRWLLLLLRVHGATAERISYTLAGAGLTAFWAVPPPFWRARHGQFVVSSVETFALAGIMMVLGVVWIAAYNLAGPLQLVLSAFRRGGAVTAAVKMAVAYPLQHRFRTSMAVAMFSLVIFAMVLSAALLASAHDAYVRRERPPTGYDITATAPAKAALTDIQGAIAAAPASKPDEFAGVGSAGSFSAQAVDLSGSGAGWRSLSVHLADEGLLRGTRPALSGRANGYASDAAVWDAMLSRPGAAVIARGSLPSANDSTSTAASTLLRAGNKSFPPAAIWLRDDAGAPVKLTVIGIVNDPTALSSGLLTLRSNAPLPSAGKAVPTAFLFKTRPGRDPSQAALGLDLSFGLQGLQTDVPGEGLRNVQTVRQLLNYLLEGFVGLGLVSGMAALGVISTRAVVERRQEIGMLRAIGLQRRQVQFSFLLEVSFIAWLGIVVGVALGLLLAHNVVVFLANDFRELQLSIPWREIALIAGIAYLASLASTIVAAWQAGRIDPAEALRYE